MLASIFRVGNWLCHDKRPRPQLAWALPRHSDPIMDALTVSIATPFDHRFCIFDSHGA
jgi:hypothetical protein